MSTSQSVTPLPIEDYEAIESAVMETARGRWFLSEYARRNRNSDTEAILGTLDRIERQIRRDRAVPDIDRIRLDLADMAEAITRTKQEIAQMKLDTDNGGRFSGACHELDAIVGQTEQATNEILMSAEGIQETAWTLREAGAEDGLCDRLDALSTDIYTACSFQDLTGQRTRKVVTVLRYLESRINSMMMIWGLGDSDLAQEAASGASTTDPIDERPDAHLLNGPQLQGHGIEQNDIDDLMAAASVESDDDGTDDDLWAPVEPETIVAEETAAPIEEDPSADDLPADVFAADDGFDLSGADVFATPQPSPETADDATAEEEGSRTLTITVGNVRRIAEVVPAPVATAAPELAVVPSEDPLAELDARRRIVTFG
jgi:hypothetical protein